MIPRNKNIAGQLISNPPKLLVVSWKLNPSREYLQLLDSSDHKGFLKGTDLLMPDRVRKITSKACKSRRSNFWGIQQMSPSEIFKNKFIYFDLSKKSYSRFRPCGTTLLAIMPHVVALILCMDKKATGTFFSSQQWTVRAKSQSSRGQAISFLLQNVSQQHNNSFSKEGKKQ